MTKQNPLLIGTFCMALFATALGGTALWKLSSVESLSQTAKEVSDEALAKFSRVKPWAMSRDELATALQDAKIIGTLSGSTPAPVQEAPVVADMGERRYGDPAAQFTFIEYSDFECPYCKTFAPVPRALVDGSRGNISLIFKHVPIHGEASRKAAFAAECAAQQGGNDAFYKMSDSIFENTQSNGNGTRQPLAALASSIGLNGPKLSRCIDDNVFFEKVKGDFKEAVDLGVKVTPTTVVRYNKTNQSVTITGAVTPNDLLQAMGQLVKGHEQ